jgi:hypothetical protein
MERKINETSNQGLLEIDRLNKELLTEKDKNNDLKNKL